MGWSSVRGGWRTYAANLQPAERRGGRAVRMAARRGAGETHVEVLVLGLELEADGVEGGEVELGEVGGGDEGFRSFVSVQVG